MRASPLVVLLGALAAVGVSYGVVAAADSEIGLIWLLVTVIALTMTVAFFARAEKRLPLLCDPMCLMIAFCSQFFVIGPLCLPAFEYHLLYHLPLELIAKTLLGFLVLFTCFFAAYQSPFAATLADRLPDFEKGRMKLPGRWAEWIVLGGSFVGIGLFFYYQGGLFEWLSLGYGQGKHSGIYQLPFHTLILGTILMCWRIVNTPKPAVIDVFIFAGLLLTELVFYGIVLGIRNRVIFLFFSLYTVWVLRRGFTRLAKLALVPMLAGLLIFFSVWGAIRARPVSEMMEGKFNPLYRNVSVTESYMKSVAEPFAVACIVMDLFPTVEPYRHGRTLLVTLLGFIPRAVWPEKPIGFGKEITKYTDGIFYDPRYGHSLTMTFVGDFYVNAGWFGIVVGGLAFGFLCRVAATYTAEGMRRGGRQTVAARVLVGAVFATSLAEVRADSATFLAYHGMVSMWLVLTMMFFRLGSPAKSAQASHVPDVAPRLVPS